MIDIAIRVENLSKLYRIGQRERYGDDRGTTFEPSRQRDALHEYEK